MLGVIHGEKGNLSQAQKHFEKCLGLLDRGEERELVASVESNLAIIMNIQGKYEKAAFYFEKALESLDKLSDLSDPTKEVLRANLLVLIKKLK